MKFKHTQSKAHELLWLVFAAMSLAAGVHKTIYNSFQASWYFFAFVLVSLLMYFIWKNKRIKEQ